MGTIATGQGHAPASADGFIDLEAEDTEFSAMGAPEKILELCAASARFVETTYGVPLDFSGDTLSLLDQYVRDARASVKAKPETFDLVAFSIGGYLGETLRRTFGGEWFIDGEPHQYRLYFSRVKLSLNPLSWAREALLEDDDQEYPSALSIDPQYRALVEAQLKALPEVPSDEYYLPSTRFDTVTVVVELLLAKMDADGVERVRLTRQDY